MTTTAIRLCTVCSGEGLYQVLETVESGLLAADDVDADGDVSQQEQPATTDQTRTCPQLL